MTAPLNKLKEGDFDLSNVEGFANAILDVAWNNKITVSKSCPESFGAALTSEPSEGICDFVLQSDGKSVFDIFNDISGLTQETIIHHERFVKFKGSRGYLDLRAIPIIHCNTPNTNQFSLLSNGDRTTPLTTSSNLPSLTLNTTNTTTSSKILTETTNLPPPDKITMTLIIRQFYGNSLRSSKSPEIKNIILQCDKDSKVKKNNLNIILPTTQTTDNTKTSSPISLPRIEILNEKISDLSISKPIISNIYGSTSNNNNNVQTLKDTLHNRRHITERNILKWSHQIFATLHSCHSIFHTVGYFDSSQILLISDEVITSQFVTPIRSNINPGKKYFFDLPEYYKDQKHCTNNISNSLNTCASISLSARNKVETPRTSSKTNSQDDYDDENITSNEKKKKKEKEKDLELLSKFGPRNAWIDVYSKYLANKSQYHVTNLPIFYFEDSFSSKEKNRTPPQYFVELHELDKKSRTGIIYIPSNVKRDKKAIIYKLYNEWAMCVQQNMRELGLIIIQLLLRRELETKEISRYSNIIIIDKNSEDENNNIHTSPSSANSPHHEDEVNWHDEESSQGSFDSGDFFSQNKKKKKKKNSKHPNKLGGNKTVYQSAKERAMEKLLKLKEKVSKSLTRSHNSQVNNILLMEELEEELPTVMAAHPLLKELIKLCFHPVYPTQKGDAGSQLRLEIFSKYKEILENLRKVVLEMSDAVRYEKPVLWTAEDERLRLEEIETKKKEMEEKAEAGIRRTELRLREEREKIWFEQQTTEVRELIRKKRTARERAVINRNERIRLLHFALFHHWPPEESKRWILLAITSCYNYGKSLQEKCHYLSKKYITNRKTLPTTPSKGNSSRKSPSPSRTNSSRTHTPALSSNRVTNLQQRDRSPALASASASLISNKAGSPRSRSRSPSRPRSAKLSSPPSSPTKQKSRQSPSPSNIPKRLNSPVKAKRLNVPKNRDPPVALDASSEERMRLIIDLLQPIITSVHASQNIEIPANASKCTYDEKLLYQDNCARIFFTEIIQRVSSKLTSTILVKAIEGAREDCAKKLRNSTMSQILTGSQLEFKTMSLTSEALAKRLFMLKDVILKYGHELHQISLDWVNNVMVMISYGILVKFDEDAPLREQGERIALSRLIGCYKILKLKKILQIVRWQSQLQLDRELQKEEQDRKDRLESARKAALARRRIHNSIDTDEEDVKAEVFVGEIIDEDEENKKLEDIIWSKKKKFVDKKTYVYIDDLEKIKFNNIHAISFKYYKPPESLEVFMLKKYSEIVSLKKWDNVTDRKLITKRGTISIRITGSLAQSLFAYDGPKNYEFVNCTAAILEHPKSKSSKKGKIIVILHDKRQYLTDARGLIKDQYYHLNTRLISTEEKENRDQDIPIYNSFLNPKYLYSNSNVLMKCVDLETQHTITHEIISQARDKYSLNTLTPMLVPTSVNISKSENIDEVYLDRDFIDIDVGHLCCNCSYDVVVFVSNVFFPLEKSKRIRDTLLLNLTKPKLKGLHSFHIEDHMEPPVNVITKPGLPDRVEISRIKTEVFSLEQITDNVNSPLIDSDVIFTWQLISPQTQEQVNEESDDDFKLNSILPSNWNGHIYFQDTHPLRSNGSRIDYILLHRRLTVKISNSINHKIPSNSSNKSSNSNESNVPFTKKTPWEIMEIPISSTSSIEKPLQFMDEIFLPSIFKHDSDVNNYFNQILPHRNRGSDEIPVDEYCNMTFTVCYKICAHNGFGNGPLSDSLVIPLSNYFIFKVYISGGKEKTIVPNEEIFRNSEFLLSTLYSKGTSSLPPSTCAVDVAGSLLLHSPLTLFPPHLEDNEFKVLTEEIAIQNSLKKSIRQRKRAKPIPLSNYVINFANRINNPSQELDINGSRDSSSLSSTDLLQLYFTNSKSASLLADERKINNKSSKNVAMEVFESIPKEKFERHFYNY